MIVKTALITGVSGQDGALLAAYLLAKGYRVAATSRDPERTSFHNLTALGIRERVELHAMTSTDADGIARVLRAVEPHEIYNLAGQSSVGASFDQPLTTFESIALGTIHLLEAIRIGVPGARYFNASSGECFGETTLAGANESTPFCPSSPYGVAKASSYWTTATYRESYGIFACSGLLFNHESPMRTAHFVTRKIVAAACRIAAGSGERLRLGDVTVRRDWGWAPEYVEAMWRMLQRDAPADFVIATGQSHTLDDLVSTAFAEVGLVAKDHVDFDASLVRPRETSCSVGDPTRAREVLGWQARSNMRDVVRNLVAAERRSAPPAP